MAQSSRISNAKGLYLEGIRDGNMRQALDKYTGERYIQHSTGVGDGKEGFIAFFEPFLARNPVRDIQVIRAIEDGRYVFCHVYQNLNNGEAKWVTADLFDTDEAGRMIEHWDVIAPYVWPTASGRTMVDGPAQVEDLHKTGENKAIVRAFADDVLMTGNEARIGDYISAEQYDQHNPYIEDGLEGFAKHLEQMAATGNTARYIKVHHLIGQGNFVVIYSHVKTGDDDWAFFDIFRLKAGKIVEHWDTREQIGPVETWNNSGKF